MKKIGGKRARLKREVVLLALARAGEVTLQKLLEAVVVAGEVTGTMMRSSKRESARELMRVATRSHDIRIDLVSKTALSLMVSRLVKEGLVSREGKKVSVTKKGINAFSRKQREYPKKLPEGRYVLVIFDIPETPEGRRKRQWVRDELVRMGFVMVQKSVWKGDVVIPKLFLKEIYELRLNDAVHIFEVTKYGTLN